MYPELFHIGSFPVNTYGVLMALAFMAALFVSSRLGARDGLPRERVFDLGLWMLLGGLIGSKLLLMVAEPEYGQDWHNLLSIDFLRSGGVWYGGFLGGFLTGVLLIRRYRLSFWKVTDAFAPGVALGQAIGREGCFAAGCCWGRPTDVPWGVEFGELAHRITGVPTGVHLHPTQLYESLAALLIFLLLYWLHRRKRFDGQIIGAYAVLYGLTRFTIEFFRDDPRGDILGLTTLTGLSTSQLISLLVVAGGLVFLGLRRRRTAVANTAGLMNEEQAKLEGAAPSLQPEPEAGTLAFDVSAEEAGARLDAFLAARIEGVSRSALKRAIEDGDVLVGGRAAKPSLKLKGGEHVEVELPAPPPSEVEPEEIPLDLLHEDEEVVVVNKPAGLVVHPAAGVHGGTLANALAFHFGRLSDGGGSLRPGIVHRLDRDTSGAIVVAKTARAHESLSEQFRARTVFKSYVALVHGVTREERGRIEEPLARDPHHRTRMAVVRNGRAALSLWRVRRRFTRFTLLDVQIKTGRTHQIRVHLAWLKYPVVGDETYGGGRDKTVPDPPVRARINALGRQFLHAERLGFHHPATGEWLSFTAPLPPELATFLEPLD